MNKTKKKKIIIASIMAIICTIITCIPIFAYVDYSEYVMITPSDIGSDVTSGPRGYFDNMVHKFYMKFTILDTNNNSYAIRFRVLVNDIETYTELNYIININSGNLTVQNTTTTGAQSNIIYPLFTYNNVQIDNVFYIPIYLYNTQISGYTNINIVNGISFNLYDTTEASQDEIRRQAYEIGYLNGYNTGYENGLYDGQNLSPNLNIVEHIEQLIGQFTGQDVARYITPIAVVLTILMVYFLFIRFLLSMIKAKGVIKVCDITMLVGMIIILVVMYSPMLNLTIKTESINETTTQEETLRLNRIDYIYDENGRIIAGPGGTIVYNEVETTTSEQQQTDVEVSSQLEEREIITYEEETKNINNQ